MKADIEKTVTELCNHYPSVAAAYLFGSTVTGNGKTAGDIDIAFLLYSERAEAFDLLSFLSDLEDRLGRVTDVVVLNRAGELINHEVRRTGRLLLDRSPEFRKAFEIRGRKRFEDFRYLHQRYVDRVLYGRAGG